MSCICENSQFNELIQENRDLRNKIAQLQAEVNNLKVDAEIRGVYLEAEDELERLAEVRGRHLQYNTRKEELYRIVMPEIIAEIEARRIPLVV